MDYQKWNWNLDSYPKICDANSKGELRPFKQQLFLKSDLQQFLCAPTNILEQ